MAITVITMFRVNTLAGTFAAFIITGSADSARMYGMTLVTTARFTSAPNCSDNEGEMVDSASKVCRTPRMIMPVMGAPKLFVLANALGNMLPSAADLAVDERVNCQPSSEPRQAATASAMMMEPTVGLNILANARPKGPVELASSALGTMPWITAVEST